MSLEFPLARVLTQVHSTAEYINYPTSVKDLVTSACQKLLKRDWKGQPSGDPAFNSFRLVDSETETIVVRNGKIYDLEINTPAGTELVKATK